MLQCIDNADVDMRLDIIEDLLPFNLNHNFRRIWYGPVGIILYTPLTPEDGKDCSPARTSTP